MMETSVILLVVLGAIAGSGRGDGVLPDRLTAAAAGTTTFTTTLAPPERPFVVVAWSFAGNNIITSGDVDTTGATYAGRITLLRSTGSLELRNLTLADGGKYTVTIIPDGAAALTGSCVLSVHEPVSGVVVTSHSLDLVESSSSVRLSCSSSGSSLSFLWLNSSSEVTASDRVHTTDGGSTLVISNVTRYDQGPFRCRVSNPVSTGTSGPVDLTINYGPEKVNLTSPLQGYYAEGSEVVLTCSASSRPAASFHWFHNGAVHPGTGAELRLMDIQMNQSGNYSCQAFNNRTLRYEASQSAAVNVLAPVSGVKVNVSTADWWSPAARSSEVTASDRVHTTDGGSTLVISNVTRYDQGPFRCRVSNGVNSEISRPFSLNILYGPDQTIITAPPALHPGDFAVLHCSAPSAPPATILWTFEGEATEVSEAVLVLPRVSPSDGGTYGCTAVNAATGRHRSASHAVAVADKGGVKRNQSDIYKISEAAQKQLYPYEVSNYSNYQKEAETSRKLQDFQSEKF
eukprot:XP_011604277.1 PREDICTED: carcinoembryonic antigen-related cell adhesion molecule 8-like [Takifugu rubripes]